MQNEAENRIRAAFEKQTFMHLIGATLTRIAEGEVEIELPFRQDLCQQHGFVHAAVVTAIVDTACGFAAASLMPPEAGVLTVEYKANFMSPAKGDNFVAVGRVVKAGRTLTTTQGDVFAITSDTKKHIVAMQATMMTILPPNP